MSHRPCQLEALDVKDSTHIFPGSVPLCESHDVKNEKSVYPKLTSHN